MKKIVLLLGIGLCIALSNSALGNDLVRNALITGVEQSAWVEGENSVTVTYSGSDLRCVINGEQKIVFRASNADELIALNRISSAAMMAMQLGSPVTIVSKIAGNCATANGVVIGSASGS